MTILTTTERPDSTYNISVGDKLEHELVEKRHLRTYLASYGILGDKLDDVMSELAAKGKARVGITVRKLVQV